MCVSCHTLMTSGLPCSSASLYSALSSTQTPECAFRSVNGSDCSFPFLRWTEFSKTHRASCCLLYPPFPITSGTCCPGGYNSHAVLVVCPLTTYSLLLFSGLCSGCPFWVANSAPEHFLVHCLSTEHWCFIKCLPVGHS